MTTAKKVKGGKYAARTKEKVVPLVERDGAIPAARAAFKAAASEAKRVAAEKFLDREDVAARSLRDLGSLLMLCSDHPFDAIEYGVEHIRKNSKMFEGA